MPSACTVEPGFTPRSSAVCCSTTATGSRRVAREVVPGGDREVVDGRSTFAGTPMTVPCTFVFPFCRNTDSVVVPRVVVAAATPSTLVKRPLDGIGVAADDGEVGEVGLGVEVAERRVEVADRRPEADEHGDARRDEDRGEDEAEPMTGSMLHEGRRLSHPRSRTRHERAGVSRRGRFGPVARRAKQVDQTTEEGGVTALVARGRHVGPTDPGPCSGGDLGAAPPRRRGRRDVRRRCAPPRGRNPRVVQLLLLVLLRELLGDVHGRRRRACRRRRARSRDRRALSRDGRGRHPARRHCNRGSRAGARSSGHAAHRGRRSSRRRAVVRRDHGRGDGRRRDAIGFVTSTDPRSRGQAQRRVVHLPG